MRRSLLPTCIDRESRYWVAICVGYVVDPSRSPRESYTLLNASDQVRVSVRSLLLVRQTPRVGGHSHQTSASGL
ncbi:hypothetical protein PISMIDRAFT_688973, partial [Pisolithus microcarpus 441]